MAAISIVYTLPFVAGCLGIGEDLLAEFALNLEPEDGVLWVYDGSEHGCYGFTDFGIESVRGILADKPTLAICAIAVLMIVTLYRDDN